MKQVSIWILALFMGLGTVAAQFGDTFSNDIPGAGHKTLVKLGLIRTVYPYRRVNVGAERAIGKHFSFNAEVALGVKGIHDRLVFLVSGWQFGLSGRWYFALRRQRLLSGFYTSLMAKHNRYFLAPKPGSGPLYRDTWYSLGAIVGYQHAITQRIRVDAGIGGSILQYSKDQNLRKFLLAHGSLSIGYSF